jgi:DNA-binding NtrC family response regulator
MVEAGSFREDLYYRLNVLSIHVPPLRERLEDVEELARARIRGLALENARNEPALSEEAISFLEKRSWPGNVRELNNVITRAALLANEAILEPRHFDLVAAPDTRCPRTDRAGETEHTPSLRQVEEELIRRTVSVCGGNRSRAARELGIHRATLYNKMRLYGI